VTGGSNWGLAQLALTLLLIQAGFQSFTASLPITLTRAGVSDSTIGVIVGSAPLAQLPAAIAIGAIIDRYGGVAFLCGAAVAYIIGSAILLTIDPSGSIVPLVAARISQGVGLAAAVPAALAMVHRLTNSGRRGLGLALVNSAHNLAVVLLPPLSLAVLARFGLFGVALGALVVTSLGLVLALGLPRRLSRTWITDSATQAPPLTRTKGRLGQARLHLPSGTHLRMRFAAVRGKWLCPLAIVLMYDVHFGVMTAYLPARAERHGADIAVFFALDGLGVLASRVPVGWLSDRVPRPTLILIGLIATIGAVLMVMTPLSTLSLLISGALTGIGAGFAVTAILVELSARSNDTDRGTAFSMFNAALAAGMFLGSFASAPVVGLWGFFGAALVALGCILVSAALVLRLGRPHVSDGHDSDAQTDGLGA
jgi:MFS family permease